MNQNLEQTRLSAKIQNKYFQSTPHPMFFLAKKKKNRIRSTLLVYINVISSRLKQIIISHTSRNLVTHHFSQYDNFIQIVILVCEIWCVAFIHKHNNHKKKTKIYSFLYVKIQAISSQSAQSSTAIHTIYHYILHIFISHFGYTQLN